MAAINFLIQTIFSILTLMFMLRFVMQAIRVSFNNPIGQMVIALTDFAVKPVRRFVPSFKKLDLSTLLLAFLVQLLLQFILVWLQGISTIWPVIIGRGVLGVIRTVFDIFFYAIILQVILSWVNPNTPIAPVLNSITRPILAPIQKIIPSVSGIDFSPLVAIILLQMLNISFISVL